MKAKISPLLLTTCLAATLLAQDPNYKPAYPKREFKHDGKIVSEYLVEDGVGSTYVTLPPVFIDHSEAAKTSLRLAAGFAFVGKTPVKPKHINLEFYSLYPECKISSSEPDLTLLIDGQPLKLKYNGAPSQTWKPDEEGVVLSGSSETEGAGCDETLTLLISQKNFLKLVNARSVEIQVDELKFKLTEANLEALRDLASRMVM
jgi:hypothetical protein